MSETKAINPHEILVFRRKIKRFSDTGIQETMKILKTVRSMNLDNKMLRCTEFPRVLLWVASKLKSSEDESKVKLLKMCKFLFAEYKKQLEQNE